MQLWEFSEISVSAQNCVLSLLFKGRAKTKLGWKRQLFTGTFVRYMTKGHFERNKTENQIFSMNKRFYFLTLAWWRISNIKVQSNWRSGRLLQILLHSQTLSSPMPWAQRERDIMKNDPNWELILAGKGKVLVRNPSFVLLYVFFRLFQTKGHLNGFAQTTN